MNTLPVDHALEIFPLKRITSVKENTKSWEFQVCVCHFDTYFNTKRNIIVEINWLNIVQLPPVLKSWTRNSTDRSRQGTEGSSPINVNETWIIKKICSTFHGNGYEDWQTSKILLSQQLGKTTFLFSPSLVSEVCHISFRAYFTSFLKRCSVKNKEKIFTARATLHKGERRPSVKHVIDT